MLKTFYRELPELVGITAEHSLAHWTSILKLATIWVFPTLRQTAIENLGSIASPVDRIMLGQTYKINSPWLPKAFADVCLRQDVLTHEEGRVLGMETVIRIAEAREVIRNSSSLNTQMVSSKLDEYFGPDIASPCLPHKPVPAPQLSAPLGGDLGVASPRECLGRMVAVV